MSERKDGLKAGLSQLAEGLLPWYLSSGGLNQGEDQELARRRAPPVTSTVYKGQSMADPKIVSAAKKAIEAARNNPQVLSTLTDYYKKATGKTVDFASAAASAIAAKGPAPAAVVLRGAVRGGLNPDDLFEGVILREQADAATGRIIDELRGVYQSLTATLDAKAAIHSGGNLGQALFRKEVVLFAQRVYGSPQAIREAHAKLRAFLAMDTLALEETLALHLGR